MNDKEMGKLFYLKRLLSIYTKFLSGFEAHDVAFNEKTKQVKVTFVKKVPIMLDSGIESVGENKKEKVFFTSELGRVIVIYKTKLREKFKNRHK